jgi:hypothetical protein
LQNFKKINNRMTSRIAIIGISVITTFALKATAQTNINGQVNTITTGVPFLRISPDARSGGMGDVGVAISPDANSQYWNVGKIPFSQKKFGVSVTYTPWLRDLVPDISLAYLSGYAKFGKDDRQAVSASLRYFSLGDIGFTDANAQSIGTGKPREFSFDAGYSQRFSDYLSAGVSLRYVNSSLLTGINNQNTADYKPGNTFAADAGVYYTKTKDITEFKSNTLSLGAVVSNLGGKISYNSTRRDFLPINLGLGVAYNMKLDEYNQITVALDLNKLLVPTPTDSSTEPGVIKYHIPNKSVASGVFGSFGDAPGGFSEELKEIQISLGAEYWYQNQFAVRAGYFYENKLKGDRKYLTLGIGVRYKVFQLNGAYLVPSGSGITRNPLSNTFRFSLMFEFDKLEKADDSGSE